MMGVANNESNRLSSRSHFTPFLVPLSQHTIQYHTKIERLGFRRVYMLLSEHLSVQTLGTLCERFSRFVEMAMKRLSTLC
jgi:hypothetical protein